MALTASIAALQRELWRKDLYANVAKEIYFERFISRGNIKSIGLRKETSPMGIVQEIEDLSAQPGYKISFGLTAKLTADGSDDVVGDAELEGNESAITAYSETLSINQMRKAVRLTGRMDEKKNAYNMRLDAREKLTIWLAERVQADMFHKVCGNTAKTFANTPDAPAASRSVFAGGQSAANALTATMTFDTKVIGKAKQVAQLATPKVRPIMVGGKAYYVIVVHPYQAEDLRKDPVWNQAQRDAQNRGDANPIFTGSLGTYNQCVIHEHEDIYTGNDGDSSTPVARAVLLGAQALILAYGSPVKWVEKAFDFDNKWALACGRIWGCVKPLFNSVDYGVVTIYTAATAASTA